MITHYIPHAHRLRRLVIASLWSATSILTVAALQPSAAFAAPSISSAPVSDVAGAERDFVQRLNQTRASHGLPALVVNDALSTTSRSWSGTMATRNSLAHDPDLAAIASRTVPGWQRVGENVGVGYDVPGLHDAFYKSVEHRNNMLGDFNQVGTGVVYSGGRLWVTVRFVKGPLPRPRIRPDRIGVHRPTSFLLRSSLSAGAATTSFAYGDPTDIAFLGDWNGDGIDTPGVFRNGTWYLRNSGSAGAADIVFRFGDAGDVPIVGDWDGNGIDTIGVRRGRTFYLRNANSNGPYTRFDYGNVGDVPIVGDWDGNRTTTVGVRRGRTFYLRNANSNGPYTRFDYGNVGDVPIVGDWDGNRTETIGVRRGRTFYLRNANSNGPYTRFDYGDVSDRPLVGGF